MTGVRTTTGRTRAGRPSVRWAVPGLLVALLVLAGVATVGATTAIVGAVPASAQTGSTTDAAADPATAPCFEGAPPRTGAPGDGPAPVGRCEPTGGQRLVDGFVWLWLVVLLGAGVVLGIRWVVRGERADGSEPGHGDR